MRTKRKRLASKRLIKKMKAMRTEGSMYKDIGARFNVPLATAHHYINNSKSEGWIVPPFLSELTNAEWGYLAGMVDGEGTINLYYKRRGTSTYPQVHIAIYNTNDEVIEYLQTLIPFYHSVKQRPEEERGRKPVHMLRLWGVPAQYFFLKSLLPYLIIKRRNAEKCLIYLKSRLRDIEDVE